MSHQYIKLAAEISPALRVQLRKSISRHFFPVNGNATVGLCHDLDRILENASDDIRDGATIATVYDHMQEDEHMGIERRTWTVRLVENGGAMQIAHRHSRWGFFLKLQERNYCTCHPEYKNHPVWKCNYCHSRESATA